MKTLVLGGRGMLGHALADVFADWRPRILDVNELDITNQQAVNDLFAKEKPGLVLNAAAYTNVDGCEENENIAMAVNGSAVGYLAEASKKIGAVLVHYSTDYVFQGSREEGYREDDEPEPLNAYGRTKLAGEEALQASGTEYLLLRTSWLFGPNGKNFVDTILKKAKEVPELSVVNDQHGCPTYTVDLARKTRELVEQTKRGIHHTTNAGVTTWYDFAVAALELSGVSTPVQPISSVTLDRKARRPAFSVLLNTKDAPMRSWQEALRDYCDYLRASQTRS